MFKEYRTPLLMAFAIIMQSCITGYLLFQFRPNWLAVWAVASNLLLIIAFIFDIKEGHVFFVKRNHNNEKSIKTYDAYLYILGAIWHAVATFLFLIGLAVTAI